MLGIILNSIFLVFILKFVSDIVLVFWCMKKYGVPYAPTAMGMVKKLVKDLELRRGMKVVELGSGDGRVSVEMARVYPIKVVGFELNRWLLFWSKLKAMLTPFKKGEVRFIRQDLFKADLREFDGIYMYLLPTMIEKLKPKLERLGNGVVIMSFDYPIKNSKKLILRRKIEGRRPMWVYKRG